VAVRLKFELDFKFLRISQDPRKGDMETPTAIMIKLPESFGSKEAKKLRRELKEQIVAADTTSVIVDLSRVKTIDTPGLEGLLSCMQEIARHDGSVQLGAVSQEAATILELARMDTLFAKFPSTPTQIPSVAVSAAGVVEEPQTGTAQPQPVAA
jgi:anti-anti-sigma factor